MYDQLMDFFSKEGMMQYLVPLLFIGYGIWILVRPPQFGSGKGFATKKAVKNEKVWYYVHNVAGKVCIVFGVILGVAVIGTRMLVEGMACYYVQIGLTVLFIILLLPVINWFTDRKFDWNK